MRTQETQTEATVTQRRSGRPPFFSICIPQYSRYPFLLEQLDALARQSYRSFEVCISDDFSTEQAQAASVIRFLEQRGLAFAYAVQPKSLRYDANLRAAIDLAQGDYLVLMGNDDKFASDATLELLHQRIVEHSPVAAAITNYREIPSGRVFRRILRDGIVGSGVEIAAQTYRNYAFVSGLVLRREDAMASRTEEWDGSEMYQMFLGSRIVASGGRLLGLTEVAVLKDIQIPGQEVDSYRKRRVTYSDRITERVLPLSQIPSLVWNAIAPLAVPEQRSRLAWSVLKQMLLYTYPYWMVELRRVQSFRYAFEVCLGMRSRHLTRRMEIPTSIRWATRLLHAASSFVGLAFPRVVFYKLAPLFHKFAKRRTST